MEEQEIIIRPLSPELCEDWLYYFDKIAFRDHGDWAFCYCLEGRLDRKTQEQWTNPGERREKAAAAKNPVRHPRFWGRVPRGRMRGRRQ